MSYEIAITTEFEREAKYLAKKYISLKADLKVLIEALSTNPTLGVPLGNNTYKIRLAISSKRKGKSGGARIISFVTIVQQTVFLIAIYDKSERQTIAQNEINERLKKLR